MSATQKLLALLPVLLLAGCGGTSSSSTTATTGPASAAATSSVSATAATSSSSTAASPTRTAAGGNGSGGAGLPGASMKTAQTAPARVPATFQLEPGGRLSPPTISIPAFLAVALSVTSHDAARHTVTVRTPSPTTLSVAPHGHAATMVRGLRAGRYAILVDGHPGGTLSIGGEPGP